jgi:hypothetical protein
MVLPPEQAYCFHIRLTGILLTKKPLRGEAWICYVLKKLLLSFVCCHACTIVQFMIVKVHYSLKRALRLYGM